MAAIPLEQRGFQSVLKKLDELAQSNSNLCIASTGTAHTLPQLFSALYQGFCMFIVCVKASLDACVARVVARDESVHIPVSDHRLKEINERALLVDLPWDLEIDTSEFQDETTIVEPVKRLLQELSQPNNSMQRMGGSLL